jgi:hypothetical protein
MTMTPASDYIAGFTPPAATAEETVVKSPVFPAIAPGEDVTYCTYLDTRVDVETDITGFRTFQSAPGHHLMFVGVRQPQDPGTHKCTDDDMLNTLTFVAGGGADSGQLNFKGVPAGLAMRLPAHTQLMLQSHWINASTTPKDGQAVAYLKAGPSTAANTPVDQFLADTADWTIPAGKSKTATTTCKFQQDMSFFLIAGHMHEWGKHVDIDIIDIDGTIKNIYNLDWQKEFMTNPPQNFYTKEAPFVVKKGQSVRTTCQWSNDTGTDIKFPTEMCYFVGYYFPAAGLMDCSDGVWPTK